MIRWTLTEQQADQVLTALGHRPFIEVNGLIGLLMQQAQQQVQEAQQAQYAQQVQEQQWQKQQAQIKAQGADPVADPGHAGNSAAPPQ
jgi:Tfp pilus assembly protein PilV